MKMKALSLFIVGSTLLLCVSAAAAQEVRYTDILLSPEKYVGKTVTMKGTFDYKNTERKSFDLKQGDNEIEVFYRLLPQKVQATILGQKNFSKVPVTVKGTVTRVANRKNSYYLIAASVELK